MQQRQVCNIKVHRDTVSQIYRFGDKAVKFRLSSLTTGYLQYCHGWRHRGGCVNLRRFETHLPLPLKQQQPGWRERELGGLLTILTRFCCFYPGWEAINSSQIDASFSVTFALKSSPLFSMLPCSMGILQRRKRTRRRCPYDYQRQ